MACGGEDVGSDEPARAKREVRSVCDTIRKAQIWRHGLSAIRSRVTRSRSSAPNDLNTTRPVSRAVAPKLAAATSTTTSSTASPVSAPSTTASNRRSRSGTRADGADSRGGCLRRESQRRAFERALAALRVRVRDGPMPWRRHSHLWTERSWMHAMSLLWSTTRWGAASNRSAGGHRITDPAQSP